MTSSELLVLAERVVAFSDKAESNAGRDLNEAILISQGWYIKDGWLHNPNGGRGFQAPNFLASLDAAMTLAPPKHDWGCGLGVDDNDGIEGWAWCGPEGEGPYTFAKTPALALTAASIRAIAAQQDNTTGDEG